MHAWESLREEAVRSGDPRLYSKSLAERYPLPETVESHYSGMTFDQVRNAEKNGLVEIGAHTVTHPFLNQVTVEHQTNEIAGSGETLANLTGHATRYFAYPGGIYQAESINLVREAGFEAAFAVLPHNPVTAPRFELGRVGIYSPSIIKLALKSAGLAEVARRLGMRVG
jgi:peptidoglycan/xylan/chitin deacetylase (PgdA/CDA1 family)